ncbi:hypothetical protein KFU94_09055 [Chloroflexi bacterium TSY]|nr:hypothetical protein [Chloroflexi bacterium TSY]
MGIDDINRVTEIKLRAERRAGELLAEMSQKGERHKGHGDQKMGSLDSEASRPSRKLNPVKRRGKIRRNSSFFDTMAESSIALLFDQRRYT